MGEDLEQRLNERGYTNWLKAGRCLVILRRGLQPFTSDHMLSFHTELLGNNRLLGSACLTNTCRARGSMLSSACKVCSEWKAEILKHHRHPNSAIYWDNCSPPSWRTHYWEVAKAYMPRGQGGKKRPRDCDASALLNLINFCDYFQSVDLTYVREVIRFRNELMHSNELEVKDEWMRRYQTTLRHFVAHLRHIPYMWMVGREIEQMLCADVSLSVSVPGLDELDNDLPYGTIVPQGLAPTRSNADIISKWEAELLRERLQELLHAAEDEDAESRDPRQLEGLGGFLRANRDLAERFSAELHAIEALQATLGHGRGGEQAAR